MLPPENFEFLKLRNAISNVLASISDINCDLLTAAIIVLITLIQIDLGGINFHEK